VHGADRVAEPWQGLADDVDLLRPGVVPVLAGDLSPSERWEGVSGDVGMGVEGGAVEAEPVPVEDQVTDQADDLGDDVAVPLGDGAARDGPAGLLAGAPA